MIEPLRLSVVLECDASHAFDVFASRTSSWWPHAHSVSRDAELTVTFEPRVGGRIFERTSANIEHDWGEILVWEPPRRLGYLWHLRADRSLATEVQIEFVPLGEDQTRMEIEQTGWDALGEVGLARRNGNEKGWGGMLPHFIAACRRSPAR
jgi:hypothetical protein